MYTQIIIKDTNVQQNSLHRFGGRSFSFIRQYLVQVNLLVQHYSIIIMYKHLTCIILHPVSFLRHGDKIVKILLILYNMEIGKVIWVRKNILNSIQIQI